ncbi:hypothetical protein [Lactiplantibacillus carotarum]|uniref:hypothetical protein n=1 Tax=Lactiplantibacillus carotarum TaxID=2993456 RepID=UPI00298EEED0|nr:hypothetical protein [Lactiplantibacillus carotarum]
MRKRKLYIWGIAVTVCLAMIPIFWLPYRPENAVRLAIVQNGNPWASLFAGPKKNSKNDGKFLTGDKSLPSYHVEIPFTSSAGSQSQDLRVKKINQHEYRAYPVSQTA